MFFASSQLVARSKRFSTSCSTNIELFNGICYIGPYGMLSLLRCYVAAKMIVFPIESCTFTPQNGGKNYLGCDVKAH